MDDITATWQPNGSPTGAAAHGLALVLLHFPHAPSRIGETARLVVEGDDPLVLGRHGTLAWSRHRPGLTEPVGVSLSDPHLSRRQVHFEISGATVQATNKGKLPLLLNGHPVSVCTVRPGDLLQIGERVLLMAVAWSPMPEPASTALPPFGRADTLGWVGESTTAWSFREQVGFVARRQAHVLITGASGTGKELVARALHQHSPRADGPFISRNAATIPESLADAELFGNAAGYPNPTMQAREGLVGAADSGTLFLDEFGELPTELQAHLLRVLDDGEYTRLGEAVQRTADLRLICATNRPLESLKHDVAARLKLRLQTPPLDARRQDIPLIALHLLRQIFKDDPELQRRFVPADAPDGQPRLTVGLVRQLVSHPYTTHVRELETLLWAAITAASGNTLDVVERVPVAVVAPTASTSLAPQAEGPVDPATLDPAVIQALLDQHGGRQDPVWRQLGLSSRHVLARLVRRHDLKVRGRG